MTIPAAVGTLSYNGVDLSGPQTSATVEMENIYDRTGRTVVETEYRIQVRAYVYAGSVTIDGAAIGSASWPTVEMAMEAIRYKLSVPRAVLQYSSRGHGRINVNTSAAYRDTDFGPKPRVVRMRLVGGSGAIELDWSVTTRIRICAVTAASGATSWGAILNLLKSWTYSISWSVDHRGLVSRTVTGEAAISLNSELSNATVIANTADQIRENLAPEIPQEFRRRGQQFSLSEDKTTISYSITDEEMEGDNAFPQGVADMNVNQTTVVNLGLSGGSQGVNMFDRVVTISGSITASKPFDSSYAAFRAILIVKDRLEKMKAASSLVLIDSLSLGEDLYGRTITFSVMLVARLTENAIGQGQFGISNIAKSTALYEPVEDGSSFPAWQASLENTAWHVRGHSRLTHDPGSEKLVDICQATTPGTVRDVAGPTNSTRGDDSDLANNCPEEKDSYLLWLNGVELTGIGRTLSLFEMGDFSDPGPVTEAIVGAANQTSFGRATTRSVSLGSQVIQAIGQQSTILVVEGRGMRLCYPVEEPTIAAELAEFVEKVTERSTFKHFDAGSYGGLRIHGATWRIVYRLTKPIPDQLKERLGDLAGSKKPPAAE